MIYPTPTLSSSLSSVQGNQISVKTSKPQHFIDFDLTLGQTSLKTDKTTTQSEFYRNLIGTFNTLNNEIVDADRLTERFLVEPEKINVHDVMITLQKSKLNLDLTRTIIQKSIEGYKTLINLR